MDCSDLPLPTPCFQTLFNIKPISPMFLFQPFLMAKLNRVPVLKTLYPKCLNYESHVIYAIFRAQCEDTKIFVIAYERVG